MLAFIASNSHTSSPLLRSKIDEHYKWLVKADDGRPHRRVPTLKAVWKAGDLKPKLEAWNQDIGRVRTHWQVRNVLLPNTVVHLQAESSQCPDGRAPSRYQVANARPVRQPGQSADEHGPDAC